MNIQNTLNIIKEKFLKEFDRLSIIIEENNNTEHGKVINSLLEGDCDDILYDLFFDYKNKDDIGEVLDLFTLLKHAFEDDGEISVVKKIKKSEFESFEDSEIYKISLSDSGSPITYEQLGLIIKTYKESQKFLKENNDIYEQAWNGELKNSKEIINQYYDNGIKTQNLMKEIYLNPDITD